MEIKVIDEDFSICKVQDLTDVSLMDEYIFIGKTDEELSLVCGTGSVPEHTEAREDGWKAFRIEGVLDFSLIGILAGISSLLANAGIGIFVVSTFNTDYVLTKKNNFNRALDVLRENGYVVKGMVC